MTRFHFLTLLILLSLFAKGQGVEWKIKSFIKDQKIDSFIIYSYPCIGYSYPIDSCKRSNTHYLLWGKNKKHFIKQFQTCHVSKSIELGDENPLSFYISNRTIINNEEIKPPEYYEFQKKRKKLDTVTVTTSVDHSCYHNFSFNIVDSVVNKSADTFDLDYLRFDTGEINVHYENNQRTQFKALIDQLLALINLLREEFHR